MKFDDQLSELKVTWNDTPAPDPNELLRKIRRARWRARLTMVCELSIGVAGLLVGVIIMLRPGWFSAVTGVATILFTLWVTWLSFSIHRTRHNGDVSDVRGQLAQLRSNAETSLRMARGFYQACWVTLAFIALLYVGSLLKLPGAKENMHVSALLAIGLIAIFAIGTRIYAKRTRRELKRIAGLERALTEEENGR